MAKGKKTGGRTAGTPNKKTVERQAFIASMTGMAVTPLEVMLEAMREQYEAGNKIAAAQLAKDAAPYIHPRLQQVEQKSDVTVRKTVSAEPMSPEEWERRHGPAATH